MSGRYSRLRFWVAAAVLSAPALAHAIGPGPGQGDKSAKLVLTVLAFPVLTLAGSAGAVVFGRRPDRTRILLRALAGALVGLFLTTLIGVLLMANSARDAGYFATAILTFGIIPAGLVGLIVGGLVTLLERKPPPS